MKAIVISAAAALAGLAQPSLQAPTLSSIKRSTEGSAPRFHLKIVESVNGTQLGWYGFVDPANKSKDGVNFQFTPREQDGTNFTVINDGHETELLQGFKRGWLAGSTLEEGTAADGAVFLRPLSYFERTGEPLVSFFIGRTNGASPSDTLFNPISGHQTVKNVTQTCFLPGASTVNKSLPDLVVGEKLFDGCNPVSLLLLPPGI